MEVRHYLAANQRDLFVDWLGKLRDTRAKVAIIRRVNRLELDNFGDHKYVRDGVWELRVDVGPGYRVYYAKKSNSIILLLCAGDKSTQDSDIEKACFYWVDWQERQQGKEG